MNLGNLGNVAEGASTIVSMVFQNSDFEKNASTSLQTLEKLKAALNFEGAVKGLETLGTGIKNVGMDQLYNGVYKVQDGFSALDVVATRVLQNITDKIQGTVANLASQALVQPLKDGFSEYELQMDSVQTIMSSTGKSIGTVNGYLDELNAYADKTIYSFSDMTANIGKFTNAGVELDKAVAAIQGVSNVAAVSGANTQEASRAMYNFAQALSAGSVKLIDWKSIENANMATVEFKEQLIQTALAMGTLTQEGDKYISTTTDANGKVSDAFNATSMFNDSLSAQWMTTDVLVQTLEQYSTNLDEMGEAEQKEYKDKLMSIYGDEQKVDSIIELARKAASAAKDVKTFSQLIDTVKESLGSGWTKTWQLIFGDLNEAKVLWTGINNVISGFVDKTADARNSMLETWHKSGYSYNKYGELIKAFYDSNGKLVNEMPEDGKVFDQYGKEIEAVVDMETGELVPQLIEGGKMLREEMGGRDLFIGGLTNTYETFAEVSKEFGAAFSKNFLGIDNDQLELLISPIDTLMDASAKLYDNTKKFKDAWTERDDKGNATGMLGQLREQFDFFMESLRSGYVGISKTLTGIGDVFSSFKNSLFFNVGVLNDLITLFSAFTGRVEDFGHAFMKHFGSDDINKNGQGLINFFNGIERFLMAGITTKVDILTNAFDALGSVFNHLIEPFGTVSQLLGIVGSKLEKFSEAFTTLTYNEDVSKFETMFQAMATELNNFIDVIRDNIDFSGITKIFDAIIEVMTSDKINLFGAFEKIFDSLLNIFEAFMAIASPVAAALANIFGDSIVEGVSFFTVLVDKFHEFTESLIPSSVTMTSIQTLFEGIFSVIKAIAEVLGASFLSAWEGLKTIFGEIIPKGTGTADILTMVGNGLKNMAEGIKALSTGDGDLAPFTDVFARFGEKFAEFIKQVKEFGLIKQAGDFIKDFFTKFKEGMFGDSEVSILDTIKEKIKGFFDTVREILVGANGLDVGDVFTAGGLFVGLKTIVDFLKDLFGKKEGGPFGKIVETITEVGEAIADTFGMIQEKLKFDALRSIATSILMIAGAVFIISTIDTPKLITALAAIAGLLSMMNQMSIGLKNLTTAENGFDGAAMLASAKGIKAIGESVLMLAVAVKVLGEMDPIQLATGLGAVAVLLLELTKVAKEFSKFEKDMAKGTAGLLAMAVAVDLLTIAVKVLGGMSWEELAKGLAGATVLIFGLAEAASLIGPDFSFGDGVGLLAMAVGIKILAGAVKTLGELNLQDLIEGLAGFAVVLGALVGAIILLDTYVVGDELVKFGAGLILFGIGIKIVSESVAILAGLDFMKMLQGLLGLVIVLGALMGAAIGIEKLSSPEATLALAALSTSLILLAGALKILSTIPFDQLLISVGAIAAVLLIMVGVAKLAEGVSGGIPALMGLAGAVALVGVAMLAFGAGLLMVSTAIAGGGTLLIGFLQQLIGLIPQVAVTLAQGLIAFIDTLAKGAGQIADSFLVMLQTIFARLMTMAPMFLQFGTMILQMLLQSLTILLPTAIEALVALGKALLDGLQVLIPEIFQTLQVFFMQLIMFLQTNFPLILMTLSMFLQLIMQTIQTNAPIIGQTLLVLLDTVLNVIRTGIPNIINTLLSLLLELLRQLEEYIPQMADAALGIIGGFLQAVADNIEQIVDAGISIAIGFMNGVAEKMPELVDSAFKLLIGFIDGLATAIDNNHEKLFEVVGHLIRSIFDAIVDGITMMVKGAGELISGFLDEFDPLKLAEDLGNVGINLVQGIIDGITGFAGHLWDSAVGLGQDLLDGVSHALGINSPSKEGMAIGQYFDQGILLGMDDGSGALIAQSENIAQGMLGAFSDTINSGSVSFNPSIEKLDLQNKLLDGVSASNVDYLSTEFAKIDMNTDLDLLKQENAFGSKVIADQIEEYNKLTDAEKNSDRGKHLLEVIQVNTKTNEYTNARIAELTGQSQQNNTYTKKNLNQNIQNGITLAEGNDNTNAIIGQLDGISGKLDTIDNNTAGISEVGSSGTTNKQYMVGSGTYDYSSSILEEMMNDQDLIDRFGSSEEIKDQVTNPKYGVLDEIEMIEKRVDTSNEAITEIAKAMSNIKHEDDTTLDPTTNKFNAMLRQYMSAFYEEEIVRLQNTGAGTYAAWGTIAPVYSSDMNDSIIALSESVSDLTPSITSSIGQSVDFKNSNTEELLGAQADSIDDLKSMMHESLGELLIASTNILEALNDQAMNIYMDSGALVGAIAPQMDSALGRNAILSRRGV